MVRYDRAFLGEALDVGRFLLKVAERNEKREISVLVAGRFEHSVQDSLHAFPECVAPWLDDHATAHLGILGQIRRADDLLIPLWKILIPPWRDGRLLFLAHGLQIITGAPSR